jgi:perosamine synthetase
MPIRELGPARFGGDSTMWVRMRFDIGWSDLAFAVRSVSAPLDAAALDHEVCQNWSVSGEMIPCLSVRSGFDLFWAAHQLPEGSEVLMSALTIPDMVRIVQHHGLVAVPVDLDVSRLAPKLEAIRRAITPATRAIVVAHLFGTRIPLEPILQIAREHNLLVVEDCAQAYAGRQYDGHPQADAAMFSFGPIKTITALGGAVLRVRDPKILARMRQRQASYPVQERGAYLRRLLKYSVLKAACSRPLCDAVLSVCRAAELNHDHLINKVVRGFPGPYFFERIRRRPSAPLLSMLARRIRTFDARRFADRTARGDYLVSLLPCDVQRPGGQSAENSYWVFPVLSDDPPALIAALARAGFDATQGSSLRVIAPPEDRPDLDPRAIRTAAAKTVFLPLCPSMPARAIRRMAEALVQQDGLLTRRPIDPSPAASLRPTVNGRAAVNAAEAHAGV